MNKKTQEKIGLYLGSFNPIHVGHLILASHIVQCSAIDKVWFVVSPLNPLKEQSSLASGEMRLELVRSAVQDNPFFDVSDAEFHLPKPSYTINTLEYLSKRYPDKQFSLIIGQDNLIGFDKWKDYDEILSRYDIYVYPREHCPSSSWDNHPNVHLIDAPQINISASYIRQRIKDGFSVQYLVPQTVYERIRKDGLYR